MFQYLLRGAPDLFGLGLGQVWSRFGEQVEDGQLCFGRALPNGSLFFVGQLVVDGLEAAEEILEAVGAGVVLVDEAAESLSQLQPGRVLSHCVHEPLREMFLDDQGGCAFVRGEAQGELFEVELVEVDQRISSTSAADDVFLRSDRPVQQF